MKDNQEELFPIVDEIGNVVDAATRGECHNGSKRLHPVVHLHVFNSQGELYLQRRPDWKGIQPGKWDTAVGGHIDYGETPREALHRETREELGITDFAAELIDKYVFESRRERELVYVNKTVYDGAIMPSTDELDGGRFWRVSWRGALPESYTKTIPNSCTNDEESFLFDRCHDGRYVPDLPGSALWLCWLASRAGQERGGEDAAREWGGGCECGHAPCADDG